MRKPIAFAVGALGLAVSLPALAQMPPAPLVDIFQSYNDCFDVVTLAAFVPNALDEHGWQRAVVTENGELVETGLEYYAHPTRAPVILLSRDGENGMCIVTARLEQAAQFEQFKEAWGGQLPAPNSEGVIFFSAEGRLVRLAETGTQEAPALSIAVMAPTEN